MDNQPKICENCGANVPKIYEDSDGRKYCCAGCLFHPLGCRCKFGEFGMVDDIDFSYDPDADYDDDDCDGDCCQFDDDEEYQKTCEDCWHLEEFCECGELPPEVRHDDDCPCVCCEGFRQKLYGI